MGGGGGGGGGREQRRGVTRMERREGDKWGGEWRGREEDVRGEAGFQLGGAPLKIQLKYAPPKGF